MLFFVIIITSYSLHPKEIGAFFATKKKPRYHGHDFLSPVPENKQSNKNIRCALPKLKNKTNTGGAKK